MGRVKELLFDVEWEAEKAAWEASPEGRVEKVVEAKERAERDAERTRREQVWRARHPTEWEEWVRVAPLLNIGIAFGDEEPFDFDAFLKEVGRRPSPAHRVNRLNEAGPYQPGNMAWVVQTPEQPASPYLDADQAAAYLGIAKQTLYNNIKHIPSLPGFRTLLFDRAVLDEVRASPRFASKRRSARRAANSLTTT